MYTLRTHPIEMPSWKTLLLALFLVLVAMAVIMVVFPIQPWVLPMPSAGPAWW